MSSPDVRTAITTAVEAAATVTVVDLSDFSSLGDCLKAQTDKAVLIQYVSAEERLASIGGEGNQGWEEDGTVVLHYVVSITVDTSDILAEMEALRKALRGKRLTADIVVEACSPFSDFGAGATGLYGGTWKGWAANLYYESRTCG